VKGTASGADGTTLSLTPTLEASRIQWTCSNDTMPARFAPSSCRQ
jgi:hypothetical protein